MKPIPKPEGVSTWIETFGDADISDTKALRELEYSCDELNLLLAVLRTSRDAYYNRALKTVRPLRYKALAEALRNVMKFAPHLIEAAQPQEPKP